MLGSKAFIKHNYSREKIQLKTLTISTKRIPILNVYLTEAICLVVFEKGFAKRGSKTWKNEAGFLLKNATCVTEAKFRFFITTKAFIADYRNSLLLCLNRIKIHAINLRRHLDIRPDGKRCSFELKRRTAFYNVIQLKNYSYLPVYPINLFSNCTLKFRYSSNCLFSEKACEISY